MFHTNNQAVNNAYGAFVQADYQLNDQWKFTAGIRWSKDILDGREYARVINHDTLRELSGSADRCRSASTSPARSAVLIPTAIGADATHAVRRVRASSIPNVTAANVDRRQLLTERQRAPTRPATASTTTQ